MQSGDDVYADAGFTGVDVVELDQQTGLSSGSVAGLVVGFVVLVLLAITAVALVAAFM